MIEIEKVTHEEAWLSPLNYWFSNLPDAAQAATLAALIAMIGVIINNVVSITNTKTQLAHDREQKARERELALRREIYLGVAENLHAGLMMLGALADTGQGLDQIMANWRKSLHYLGKLHLMAGPDLLAAVSNASGALNDGLLRIRPMRNSLESIAQQQLFLKGLIDARHAASEGALLHLHEQELSRQTNGEETARILAAGRRQVDSAQELAAKHDQLGAELFRARARMIAEALMVEQSILPTLIPVVRSARKELGQPFEPAVYDQLLTHSKSRSAALVAELNAMGVTPSDAQPGDHAGNDG